MTTQWPTTAIGNDDITSYNDSPTNIQEHTMTNQPTNRILQLANLFGSVKSQLDAIYGSADFLTMQNELYCIQRDIDDCIRFANQMVKKLNN